MMASNMDTIGTFEMATALGKVTENKYIDTINRHIKFILYLISIEV